MASSLPVVVDDDLLKCKLCCRDAVEPKLLPCLHVFCGSCLDKHLERVSAEHRSLLDNITSEVKASVSRTYKDKTRRSIKESAHRTDLDDGRNQSAELVSVEEESVEDSYEIPQRTVDDYGYQIADENAFGNVIGDNGCLYYNKISDLPSNVYIEMTSKKTDKNWSKKSRANMKLPEIPTEARTLRTFSECSNEYVLPGSAKALERVPSNIYDDVEDVTSSVVTSQSPSEQKVDSPSSVRRWKVSSAVAPPMMVRRKKSKNIVTDIGQSTIRDSESGSRNLSSIVTPPKETVHSTDPLEDIYKDCDQSPPAVDLYGPENLQSCGAYQLQKRISGDLQGQLSSPELTSVSQESFSPEPVDSDRNSVLSKRFHCPVCEDVIRVKDELKGFETCSFVSTLLEMSSFCAEDQLTCQNCETKSVTHKCLDCRQCFCSGCQDAHCWPKVTRKHQVVSLGDLRTGKHQRELQTMLSSRCQDHSEEMADYFCLVCKRLICCECLSSDEHDNHWAAPVDEVATRDRNYLESVLESGKGRLNDLASERRKLDGYCQRNDEDRSTVVRDIINQKEAIIRLIESHSAMLLEKVDKDFARERRRIEDALAVIDRLRFKMQNSFKFVGQLLEHGRSADIVELSQVAKTRLHSLGAVTTQSIEGSLSVGFHPTAITVDDIEQLYGLLTVVQPEQTVRSRDSSKTIPIEPSSPPVTTVTPRLLWSFPTKTLSDDKGCKPTGVALIGGSDTLVLVDDINKKLKVFRMDGILEREVFPAGEHRLVDPWDVAVLEGSGHFAVTDRGAKDVKIFESSGEFVSSFGPHLSNPWGIATNSLRNILVTDIVHRQVFIHDSNGILISSIPHDQQLFDCLRCPEYVAVNINDDVIVSDFEQHNVVIFDKFGRCITKYGDKKETSSTCRLKVPCGVCVDPRGGDILVADYNNRRIVRLTMNGRLRCHYSTNDSHLVMPQTLVFGHDGNLVVIDRTHVKIFALSADSVDGSEDPKPRPRQRRKSDEPRRKYIAKKTPTAPPQSHKYKRVTVKHSADRPVSAKIETSQKDKHDTDPVGRQFLETEVW